MYSHAQRYECLYAFLIACCIHVFSFDVVRRCEGIDITELHLILVKICRYFGHYLMDINMIDPIINWALINSVDISPGSTLLHMKVSFTGYQSIKIFKRKWNKFSEAGLIFSMVFR